MGVPVMRQGVQGQHEKRTDGMTYPLFASSTTYVHTVTLYCDSCKRKMPHYHIYFDYLELYRCQICDTLREREDNVRSEVLPSDTSDSSQERLGEAGILGRVMDGSNGHDIPIAQ
jgi:hypothetical protein